MAADLKVRVQGPDGMVEMTFGAGATLGELKERIAAEMAIAPAAQGLRAGFPPAPLAAGPDAPLTDVLGGAARVLVTRLAGAAAGPSAPAASASSSNRRKQQQPKRLVPPPAGGPPAGGGAPAGDAAEEGRGTSASRKRAVAAAAAAIDADDDDDDDAPSGVDPLALTMEAERKKAGGAKAGKEGGAKKPRAPKRLSAEKLATAYYLGPGNALQRAASGGGGTGDFLTEHGMAEHRTAAIGAGKYELVPRGNSLSATFRGVRKAVTEEVQLLDRAELGVVVRAIAARGSSSRGRRGGSMHLLAVKEMAVRSPDLLWSMAHEFGGDVKAGVEALLAEEA